VSMVCVPLLTWHDDDSGSVGGLLKLGGEGVDPVDNVLLELIIATALRDEPGAVQTLNPKP